MVLSVCFIYAVFTDRLLCKDGDERLIVVLLKGITQGIMNENTSHDQETCRLCNE